MRCSRRRESPSLFQTLLSGAADVVSIGDSVNDVSSARAAGVPVICVRYGYHNGEDLVAARPDAIIDSLAELSHFI